MPQVIETGLPAMRQPFSWASRAGNLLFTAHGPVGEEGAIAGVGIEKQTRLTFDNLVTACAAAGATLGDVAQVLIYMKEAEHMRDIDAIYREYFAAPYPNRSSVVVKGFVHPEMLIEIVAYVDLPR